MDHSDSEKENLLLPHRLLFPINSKGSFICTIPQTGKHMPWPLLHQSWSTGWINETLNTFHLVIWCWTYGKGPLSKRGETHSHHYMGYLFWLAARDLLYVPLADRITHTTAFVTTVVEHWLEWEIAQWIMQLDALNLFKYLPKHKIFNSLLLSNFSEKLVFQAS